MDEEELYDRIFYLKDNLYKKEDSLEEIWQFLLHSSLSIEEMEKISIYFK